MRRIILLENRAEKNHTFLFDYRISTSISVVCGRIFVTYFSITKIGNTIIEFLPHMNIFIKICMFMYRNKLSRTSTSSESVIRLTSNLSFLNQGRPTICLSRLSVRSVWNQNLINFSLLFSSFLFSSVLIPSIQAGQTEKLIKFWFQTGQTDRWTQ